jgi:hypothetical protein
MTKPLFRASGVGALLTEPKLKVDKEAGNLSATAKAFVRSTWLANEYGYREFLQTEAMNKGLIQEQDSMELVQEVLGGQFRVKNRERFSNAYLTGHPDIILPDCIEDIKTSKNLRTFIDADVEDMYEAQAMAYMELKGIHSYRLIYALVPDSPDAIVNAKERLAWSFSKDYSNADYIAQCEQIQQNNDVILTIPKEKRIKVFNFEWSAEYIERLYAKCDKAREYYNTLSL